MRWVIGDIQGCARTLGALLEKIRFDPTRDTLYALGDLVRRGPDPVATLRLFTQLGGHGVLGNHDVATVARFRGYRDKPDDTVDALRRAPDGEALVERLAALPVLRQLDDRTGGKACWLVHAGVLPSWTDLDAVARRFAEKVRDRAFFVDDPEVRAATSLRFCTADGVVSDDKGAPPAKPPFQPWDVFYKGPTLLVHGHWAQRGHYRTPTTLGLDGGCVYGGRLYAWAQEEDRVESVKSLDG